MATSTGASTDGALAIRCGTNQSDDRFRDVVYRLPAAYASVDGHVSATGAADPESRVELSLFVHDRYDRSDREREVAVVTPSLDDTVRIAGDLSGARTLTVRVRCQDPSASVTLTDVALSR